METRRMGQQLTRDTRAASHQSIDKNKRYQQILSVLQEGGPMTAKEVAVILHRRGLIDTDDRNTTAPRLTEMSQKGLVEPVGRKRCTYTGKTVAVYSRLSGDAVDGEVF